MRRAKTFTLLSLLVPLAGPGGLWAAAVLTATGGPSQGNGIGNCSVVTVSPSSSGAGLEGGCRDGNGDLSLNASAVPGILRADAISHSFGLNAGSLSASEGGADVSYSDQNFMFKLSPGSTYSGPNTFTTTLNITFDGSLDTTIFGQATVSGNVIVGGHTAIQCFGEADNGTVNSVPACSLFAVSVTLGQSTAVSMELIVNSGANNNGLGAQTAQASSLFFHTFSFSTSGNLFNLPAGVTVDAPDSFVSGNQFLPPTGGAPEPGTLYLIGAGLVSVFAARCSRRRWSGV